MKKEQRNLSNMSQILGFRITPISLIAGIFLIFMVTAVGWASSCSAAGAQSKGSYIVIRSSWNGDKAFLTRHFINQKKAVLEGELFKLVYKVVSENFKPEFGFNIVPSNNAPEGWADDSSVLIVDVDITIQDGKTLHPPNNHPIAAIYITFTRPFLGTGLGRFGYRNPLLLTVANDLDDFLKEAERVLSPVINSTTSYIICTQKRNIHLKFCQKFCDDTTGAGVSEWSTYCAGGK